MNNWRLNKCLLVIHALRWYAMYVCVRAWVSKGYTFCICVYVYVWLLDILSLRWTMTLLYVMFGGVKKYLFYTHIQDMLHFYCSLRCFFLTFIFYMNFYDLFFTVQDQRRRRSVDSQFIDWMHVQEDEDEQLITGPRPDYTVQRGEYHSTHCHIGICIEA